MNWYSRASSPILSLLLSLGLLSCNGINAPSPSEQTPAAQNYILTLKISSADSAQGLEQRYSAKMLAYQPQAGFAILLSPNQPPKTDPAITTVEPDGTISAPVTDSFREHGPITRQGSTSNMGGWTSWSGGWTSWSGGWTSWSGGWTSWSGGVSSLAPELPAQNQAAWNQIKLYEAHRISRNFGAGVKIAVIDTGIDLNHPIFQGHLAPSSQWKDYVDNDATPQEDSGGNANGKAYGHGTAVAGIILQIAPRATILPIRVLKKNGDGNTSDIVSAINYAVTQGAQVINLSLGTDGYDASLFTISKFANAAGVRIVASAGNNGTKDGVTSPGQFSWLAGTASWTMGIGSTNNTDVLSSFSAYGSGLYGVAPGEAIYSSYPSNQAVSATGTSFAAPMYSGAIALAYADMPNVADRSRIQDFISSSLDQTVAQPGSTTLKYGRLNLERTIRSLPGWTEPTTVQSGVYNLVNVNSNKCVDVPGASTSTAEQVQQWTCGTGDNQKWKIEPVGPYFKLTAVHSGKVLEWYDPNAGDGGLADQWDFTSGWMEQQWSIAKTANGFKLVNASNGKCLDVPGFSNTDGVKLQQFTCNSGDNQNFKLQALF